MLSPACVVHPKCPQSFSCKPAAIILTCVLLVAVGLQAARAADKEPLPIPEPPTSRALLPAPLTNVVMIKVASGRLNVPLGGWGGQRLIHAKTDPEKFRGYLRAVKQRGLNCVRPLFHPPNASKPNDAEWARFDWGAMDRAVAMTQEEGLYFLVDYHNWLVNDTIHAREQEWLRTWGWIIERYKDYLHLIFEGFNEPQNQCPCIAQHYQKWIDVARATGAQQLCVVSPFWGQFFGLKKIPPGTGRSAGTTTSRPRTVLLRKRRGPKPTGTWQIPQTRTPRPPQSASSDAVFS